jgi:hypothetical protein
MTEREHRRPASAHRTTQLPKRITTPGGVPLVALAAAGVALLAGMIVWNLSLRNDVASLEDRLAAVQSENATIRANANATVYQLMPTSDAPQNANGQAWFSIQGSGVLSVANLRQPGEGVTFQLWYITDSPTNPVPGGTFDVDENGQGFMLIPADVDGVTSIAISLEPVGGSASPTGDIILTSEVSDARG